MILKISPSANRSVEIEGVILQTRDDVRRWIHAIATAYNLLWPEHQIDILALRDVLTDKEEPKK